MLDGKDDRVEELLKWGAYVVVGIVGWLVRVVWARQDKLAEKQQELEVHVKEHYAKKEDLKEAIQPLFRKLDRLEELILQHLTSTNRNDSK